MFSSCPPQSYAEYVNNVLINRRPSEETGKEKDKEKISSEREREKKRLMYISRFAGVSVLKRERKGPLCFFFLGFDTQSFYLRICSSCFNGTSVLS